MSDEERKAIEVLNYIKNKTPFIFWYENKPYNRKETISTILNLIEKQSKEIKELKIAFNNCFDECTQNSWYEDTKIIEKIKAKIEELEKLDFGTDLVSQFTANLTTITILQSLLEKE